MQITRDTFLTKFTNLSSTNGSSPNYTTFIHCTKNEVSIQNFFRKSDWLGSKLPIWSHLLKKSLMKNFIFCAVILNEFK